MQVPRLTELAGKGGTVVILAKPDAASQLGVLPFPVNYAQPNADRVTREDAPIVMTDATTRMLTWPNAIREGDWKNWVGARALSLPTRADARCHAAARQPALRGFAKPVISQRRAFQALPIVP